MRLKSKYRQAFRDGGEVIEDKPIEQPAESVSAPVEAAPVVEAPPPPPAEPEPPPNDATLALQRQIEGLKHSEQLRHQQAAQQPLTRDQKLDLWKQHGLTDAEADFLRAHPAMIDYSEITGQASAEAVRSGFNHGTPEYFAAVETIFDAAINHLQAQAADMQPTPTFFAPPPAPATKSAPTPSARVSAPVSRQVPNGSGQRPKLGSKVTLTPDEVAAARISGLTVEQYAAEKLRYEAMRADGSYRDNTRER